MRPQVTSGQAILRQWDESSGLRETARRFESLDDLFALCLEVGDPLLVDRIIIDGRDDQGHERVVTFTFQSMTISNARREPSG